MRDYKDILETVYNVCDNYISAVDDYTDKASKAYAEILEEFSNTGFTVPDTFYYCIYD